MTRNQSTFRAKRESHNISVSIEELIPNISTESRLVLKPRVPGAVPEDSNNPDGLETPKSWKRGEVNDKSWKNLYHIQRGEH